MARKKQFDHLTDEDFSKSAAGNVCLPCGDSKFESEIVCNSCWVDTSEHRQERILKMLRQGLAGWALRRMCAWAHKATMPRRWKSKTKTGKLFVEAKRKAPSIQSPNLSPVMRQYQQFKQQHPGYVLFFRMGDFYELFFEDAEMASRVLGITLTKKRDTGGEIPMAGIPFHSVENYLKKLIAAGHKAAICEPVEDGGKKVKRAITRTVTGNNASSAADAA